MFSLPLGIATNFRINGRDRLIPMVVEEVAPQPSPSPASSPAPAAKATRPPGDAFGWLVAALAAPGLLVPLRLRRRPPSGG